MRIMDVQEFETTQYSKYRERRTSQFIRFLDKNVDFVTYFHINRNISTTEIGNFNIDSYIGKDSPVRYNKINNLPIYGFPFVDTRNDYNNDNAGFTADNFSGEIVMLPNIIEPNEGDCFILNSFNDRQFFQVTAVEQIVLKNKSHYVLQFHICVPDYLPQLNKQVVEEYNAVFDNIGTHDKVVMSSSEYDSKLDYEKSYSELMEFYIHKFFKPKITMFVLSTEMGQTCTDGCPEVVKYVDKFLTKFMEKNRVIVMDLLTKGCLMLDYNALYDGDDYLDYKNTLYWAIENKSINKLSDCSYILLSKLRSPFALLTGQTDDSYYLSSKFVSNPPAECMPNLMYSNDEIKYRYNSRDISMDCTAHSKIMNIITNYLHDSIIMPGYFYDICDGLSDFEQYIYIPIILYIIREQINGITNVSYTF